MRFDEGKITFQEADRRYAKLRREQESGSLGDEEFDAELKQLMVQDPEGRWWAKSPTTGEWHYHDGTAWVKDTPPGYQAPQDTSEDQPEIQQPQIDQSSPPADLSRQGLYWGVGLTSLAAILLPQTQSLISPLLAVMLNTVIQYVATSVLAHRYRMTWGWAAVLVAGFYVLNWLSWLIVSVRFPDEYNMTQTFGILIVSYLGNAIIVSIVVYRRDRQHPNVSA
jgi:hypothetical protein